MSKKKGVGEANKLKYTPEVVPTLNSYDNMCAHERKNTISCLHTIRKNKDDLGKPSNLITG